MLTSLNATIELVPLMSRGTEILNVVPAALGGTVMVLLRGTEVLLGRTVMVLLRSAVVVLRSAEMLSAAPAKTASHVVATTEAAATSAAVAARMTATRMTASSSASPSVTVTSWQV